MATATATAEPDTVATGDAAPDGAPAARGGLVRAATWVAGFLVALGVAAVLAGPWLDPRFDFLVDDGPNHATRAGVFHALLRRWAVFPRWWPELTLGYGYPLFNYYSPGAYVLAEAFNLLGASVYGSLQLVAVAAFALGAAGAFALGAVVFRSPLAALVLAVAYVGAPYPFVTTLYNRAAFPEALGLAVLPWLLAAGWLTVQRRSPPAALGLGLCLAALVLVHSLSALIGAGLLVLWLGAALGHAPPQARRRGALVAAAGVAAGLALSAFFWVPATFEQGAVHLERLGGGTLGPAPWLFDPLDPRPPDAAINVERPPGISPGPIDVNWRFPHAAALVPVPLKPSLAQALFGLAALLAALLYRLTPRRHQEAPDEATVATPFPLGVIWLGAALSVACWLMNTTWSRPAWETLTPLTVLQFPWRLYGPFALALALAGAGVFAWLARRGQQQWVLALLLALLIAVNGRPGDGAASRRRAAAPPPPVATQLREAEGEFVGSGTLSGGEFLPRSVTLPAAPPRGWSWRQAFEAVYPSGGWIAGRIWPVSGDVEVRQVWDTPAWTAARVEVGGAAGAEVAFRTLVFPGWRAYVDGRPVPLRPAPYREDVSLGHGFAVVTVPPGAHDVQLALGPTAPRTLGTLVSLVVLAAVVALSLALVVPRRQRRAMGLAAAAATVLLGAGALAVALWPTWRAPGRPGPASQAIALDLLAAVQQGQDVAISAPDGGRPGSFVDVRRETIAGESRPWLYMHPPAEVRVALDVPAGAVFQAGLGVSPRGWTEPEADGVRFIMSVTDVAGTRATLLDEVVQPQTVREHRGWRFAEVDLGPYAGQRVTLTLRTEGRDTPAFDWAGWATPAVYADRSGRSPPPTRVAPALGFVPWANPPP